MDLTFASFNFRHTLENIFTGGQHRPKNREELIAALIGNQNADLYRRDMIPHPNAHIQKTIILTTERYMNLKEKALKIWTGRVHTNNSGIISRGMDFLFPGKPTWDHKPYIGQRWAHHNRLGNKDWWVNYDIWSNMHYAYIGRKAGFTWEELAYGSGAMQKIDSGNPDIQRDTQAMREGFNFSTPPTLSKIAEIITNKYLYRWGGRTTTINAQCK